VSRRADGGLGLWWDCSTGGCSRQGGAREGSRLLLGGDAYLERGFGAKQEALWQQTLQAAAARLAQAVELAERLGERVRWVVRRPIRRVDEQPAQPIVQVAPTQRAHLERHCVTVEGPSAEERPKCLLGMLGGGGLVALLHATAAMHSGVAPGLRLTVGTRSAASALVMMGSQNSELDMWIIERARLQENYRRELLRRPRRYLPFVEARKWARAMWFTSREDWLGMINRGEKRNPYLPRRPDEYYREKGWVSWDDFLNDP
jgi:hypothetical protein